MMDAFPDGWDQAHATAVGVRFVYLAEPIEGEADVHPSEDAPPGKEQDPPRS
jgi:hypothetical protein